MNLNLKSRYPDVLTPEQRRGFGNLIPGRFLELLRNQARNKGRALIFGCGKNYLPILTAQYFPQVQVVAFDIDEVKIAEMQVSHWQHPRVSYTERSPAGKFEIVIASNVLHENPNGLTKEALEYLSPEGHIAVLDYDMKNTGREDFLRRWGRCREETVEREILGDERTHTMHTGFGLEDCRSLMEKHGIITTKTEGKLSGVGDLPTFHFIYLGKKGNYLING